jgi:hypothetical protein
MSLLVERGDFLGLHAAERSWQQIWFVSFSCASIRIGNDWKRQVFILNVDALSTEV